MAAVSSSSTFFFFLLFRAALTAYGGFQARGPLELQLPAYTRATATQDPSCTRDLHHSSQQHWILNTLSEARDRTCVRLDTSQFHNSLSTMGTPQKTALTTYPIIHPTPYALVYPARFPFFFKISVQGPPSPGSHLPPQKHCNLSPRYLA